MKNVSDLRDILGETMRRFCFMTAYSSTSLRSIAQVARCAIAQKLKEIDMARATDGDYGREAGLLKLIQLFVYVQLRL